LAASPLFCVLAFAQNLDHVREVNLARIKSLPSFVADETIVRYKSRHVDPPQWEKFDTIESEVAVQKGVNFSRKNTRWNGKPTKKTLFPGYNWAVQFGLELKPLFDPECHTGIEFEGREGRLIAYRYSAKPGNCFGSFGVKDSYFRPTKNWNPARTGRFKVEEQSGNLVEYQENASEFPKGFGMNANRLIVKWDYVKIGDSSFLLPVAWESFGGFVHSDLWHLDVTFRNHRHFEATSGITFQ
jgi:hypothetical protein